MDKLRRAAGDLGITEIAAAGGVSANSGLRNAFKAHAQRFGWTIHLPPPAFTTDNAAMVAVTGYFKYMDRAFCPMDAVPYARVESKIS